ncbi:MAG: prolyl oligopeptidase family serine peptidase [Anaerolineae bacterium]|nr:prolyl oligopeptidase family serine peptidase [Anaerolineae bacterium]
MIEQPLLESTALKGNFFNDPTRRPVTVYLPPDYYGSGERYVSLYLLASHGNTGQAFLNWKPFSENVIQKLDRMIRSGEMPPVIVVMPDCWTTVGGSQYLDSAIGNYETYLIQEIVPFMDATYRTRASADHRGVLGHSSGGYGALMQAMTHPEVFRAAACHAGDVYWEFACLPMLASLHQNLVKYGGAAEFLRMIPQNENKNSAFWNTLMAMCWSMAHSTLTDSALGFDLPIDETTGALREDIWQRWLTFDPYRRIDRPEAQAALRQMKALLIDAGSYDEFQLQVGARLFSQKLSRLEIPHLFEEFAGSHSGSQVRYERSLTLLAGALQ